MNASRKIRSAFIVTLICGLSLVAFGNVAAAVSSPSKTFLYVGVWSTAKIYKYQVKNNGTLVPKGSMNVNSDVRDMDVSPDGKYLYYASDDLKKYAIHPKTGGLTELGTSFISLTTFDDAVLDESGKYLYGTHSIGGVSVHDVSGNTPVLKQEIDGLLGPRGIAMRPGGDYVYVANSTSFLTFPDETEEILIFSRNAGNGLLTAAGFTDWTPKPYYFAVHPSGDYLYATRTTVPQIAVADLNGGGASVDSGSSPVTAGQGVTQMLIKDDDYLYATIEDEGTIELYDINSTNGHLTFIQSMLAGFTPEHMVLHPAKKFLINVSSGANSLINVYSIGGGGLLSVKSSTAIGDPLAYRAAIVTVSQCRNRAATVYVRNGVIVGGENDGMPYPGTVIRGTEGADVIVGTKDPDEIEGLGGNDFICSANGADTVSGGMGNDKIYGGGGSDDLFGDEGNDLLHGGSNGVGGDALDGGDGTDTCKKGEALFNCE